MSSLPDSTVSPRPARLLVAASGTGGHLFPAIAVAEQLPDMAIEWLGVPDRLETTLVPKCYPLHTVSVEGFQKRGLGMLKVAYKFIGATLQTRKILQRGQFQGVFTTGGYIAAPAVMAARSLGLPVLLHESNALPGKVTRLLGPWCTQVAIGFQAAARHLPKAKTICVGTPVRSQFLETPIPDPIDLPIPEGAPLIVVVGGSQGAVGLNKLVRECVPTWLDAGFWIVHITGDNDPDAKQLQHPHYLVLPFYSNMAGLFQRATLAISRSGAGTLTELAITKTPSILIPYPFAAEDHQAYNADVFVQAGAGLMFRQGDLTRDRLTQTVMHLLKESPSDRLQMSHNAADLAVPDSAQQLAALIRHQLLH